MKLTALPVHDLTDVTLNFEQLQRPLGDLAVIKEAPLNVQWVEFGAKGDGTTDDAPAINSAITTASAAGGGSVFIPRASRGYKATTPIVPRAGVELFGDGQPQRWGFNSTIYPTRILYTGSTAALLLQPTALPYLQNVRVSKLHFDGTGAVAGCDGLLLDASANANSAVLNSVFEDCMFSNFPGYQIHEKDGGVGAVWGIDFERVSAHNRDSGANDLIHWDGTPTNTTSIFWRECRIIPCVSGTWGFYGGGTHVFEGGVVAPNVAGAGAHGIRCNGHLSVLGTYLEGGLGTQTGTIGIRYLGSYGASIIPNICQTFGKGVQIGDPGSPTTFAIGAIISGAVAGFNAAAGNGDVHIVSGGQRTGTVVLCPSAVVIDDRATNDGAYDVTTMTGNRLSVPGGTVALPGVTLRGGIANVGLSQDNATGDMVLSTAGVERLRVLNGGAGVKAAFGLGAWGHAPPGAQPAAPVTLADVIAIIRGCGLSA